MFLKLRNRFLLYRFLSDLTPIAALYVLLFQAEGLSNAGISGLLILLSLAVLLFEIPTGSLADRIDRRTVLLYSRILKAACFLLWLFAPNPIGFGIGLFLWGAGTAMESGCWQAFLYDELNAMGQGKRFRDILASLFSVSLVATLVASLVGSWILAQTGSYRWILVLSAASALLAGLIARSFPSASRKEETTPEPWKKQWKESLALFVHRADAGWLFLTAALMGGIKGSLDEYHGLILVEKTVPPEWIPIVYAGLTLIGAVVFFLISKSPQKSNIKRLNALMVGTGLTLFSVFFLPANAVILILLVMVAFDSAFRIHNEALLQEVIPAEGARSTITSLASFGTELTALCVFFVASAITTQIPLGALYVGGGLLLVLIPLLPRKTLQALAQRLRK